MNDDTTKDLLEYDDSGKAILPTGLNVLTILTFIGCSIFGLLTLFMPFLYRLAIKLMDKTKSSGEDIPAKKLADMEKSRASMELALQNAVPLIIIGMAGIILCFVGALWMRKFKKDGYWLYVAGQIVPLAGSVIIMGQYQFSDWKSYAGFIIPIVFILLYTTQRKYLTK
jgi:hypothetical protein